MASQVIGINSPLKTSRCPEQNIFNQIWKAFVNIFLNIFLLHTVFLPSGRPISCMLDHLISFYEAWVLCLLKEIFFLTVFIFGSFPATCLQVDDPFYCCVQHTDIISDIVLSSSKTLILFLKKKNYLYVLKFPISSSIISYLQ